MAKKLTGQDPTHGGMVVWTTWDPSYRLYCITLNDKFGNQIGGASYQPGWAVPAAQMGFRLEAAAKAGIPLPSQEV